eukprot:GHVU01196526.1.p6 GENE.GHVU01196526.1~~GHVU01196526.1.p6  ORF type:complete len:108 (+),score=11.41 GHVU01196526.1:711-1034(+)
MRAPMRTAGAPCPSFSTDGFTTGMHPHAPPIDSSQTRHNETLRSRSIGWSTCQATYPPSHCLSVGRQAAAQQPHKRQTAAMQAAAQQPSRVSSQAADSEAADSLVSR